MGSIHNELTGRAGFISRAVRNALQVESGEVGIDRVSETLTPIFDLWSRGRPEWALLRGERLWHVAPSGPGVAAQFTTAGIFNPAGSGLIVVVEAFRCGHWGAGTNILNLRMGTNIAFTSTSTPNSRDTRTALLTGIATGSFIHNSAAEIGNLCQTIDQVVGTYSHYPLDVVLTPGFFVSLNAGIVNQVASFSFYGYERPAFPGELNARA